MKIPKIQQKIIKSYKNLSTISKVPFDKKDNVVYLWGLKSNLGCKTGYISELGNISIETNKKNYTGNFFKDVTIDIYNGIAKQFDAEIIIKDNKIQKRKKPLFDFWFLTLNKINNMLQYTTENLNNKNVVEKKQVGLFCASLKTAERIQKINSMLAKKKKS